MAKPYLIGRYLVLDCSDEGWVLAQFVDRISEFLYAVKSHSPHDGSELPGGFIIDIRTLSLREGEEPVLPHAMIFPDWPTVQESMHPMLDEDETGEDASAAPPRRLHS